MMNVLLGGGSHVMSTPDYKDFDKACEYVIPIILKVPILLEPEVMARPTVCHNGHHKSGQYGAEQVVVSQS